MKNKRHIIAIMVFIVMLPASIAGFVTKMVAEYFEKGAEIFDITLDALDDYIKQGDK